MRGWPEETSSQQAQNGSRRLSSKGIEDSAMGHQGERSRHSAGHAWLSESHSPSARSQPQLAMCSKSLLCRCQPTGGDNDSQADAGNECRSEAFSPCRPSRRGINASRRVDGSSPDRTHGRRYAGEYSTKKIRSQAIRNQPARRRSLPAELADAFGTISSDSPMSTRAPG